MPTPGRGPQLASQPAPHETAQQFQSSTAGILERSCLASYVKIGRAALPAGAACLLLRRKQPRQRRQQLLLLQRCQRGGGGGTQQAEQQAAGGGGDAVTPRVLAQQAHGRGHFWQIAAAGGQGACSLQQDQHHPAEAVPGGKGRGRCSSCGAARCRRGPEGVSLLALRAGLLALPPLPLLPLLFSPEQIGRSKHALPKACGTTQGLDAVRRVTLLLGRGMQDIIWLAEQQLST